MTPTEFDYRWLRQQIDSALAAAGPSRADVALTRTTVELLSRVVACWGDQRAAANPRYNIDAASLRPAVDAELHRLAAGDEAPSKSRWDNYRQRSLPTAQHICRVLDQNWTAIAEHAGLRPNRYAQRQGIEPAAQPAQPPQPPVLDDDDYASDWPVIATRTETFVAGNVRTTRQIYALR